MFQIAKNLFNKGINGDLDKRTIPANAYIDAQNVRLIGDSDALSVKNMRSTLGVIEDMFPGNGFGSSTNILKTIEFNLDGDKAIAIFAVFLNSGIQSKILFYNIIKDSLHDVTPLSGDLNFPLEGTIDAVVDNDSGRDVIYFDDHTNPLRDIPADIVPFDNVDSLYTQRLSPINKISFRSIIEGSGQIGAGTIQFAYRYYNTKAEKFSAPSLFTNPIPIYPTSITSERLDAIIGGQPGEICNKSVKLEVDIISGRRYLYDSIQLIVIKNTIGSKKPNPTVYLTQPNKDWYNTPDNIVYDGSLLESTALLTEITTDNAPIQNAKSLMIKDNVMFRANVNYFDRYVDSIDFTEAKTIKKKVGFSTNVYAIGELNTNNPGVTSVEGINAYYVQNIPYFSTEQNKQFDAFFGSEVVDKRHFYVANAPLRYSSLPSGNNDVTEAEYMFNPYPNASTGNGYFTEEDGYTNIVISSDVVAGNIYQVSYSESVDFLIQVYGLLGPINEFAVSNKTLNALQAMHKFNYLAIGINDMGEAPYLGETIDEFSARILSTAQIDYNIINSFRTVTYIAKQGDTNIDVALNLSNQLNAATSNKVTITSTSNQIDITTSFDTIIGDNLDRKGAAFFTYAVGKGGNTEEQSITIDNITDPDSVSGGYKNPNIFTNYRGYFRDEVYRFGIVYQDEFGNWSNAVPLRFNKKSKEKFISDILITGATQINNTATLTLAGGSNGIQAGDSIYYEDNIGDFDGYYLVMNVDATTIDVAFGDADASVIVTRLSDVPRIYKTNGGEYNWSDGDDWRFPTRSNKKFTMFDHEDDADVVGAMYPIGLKIFGITNHPTWAKAFAVVRMPREKDILWQSIHVPTIAAMPSMNISGDTCVPTSGATPIGSFAPKVISKGNAKNFQRDSSIITGSQQLSSRLGQNNDRANIMPLSVVFPSEILYQNEGTSYDPFVFPNNCKIDIVDAVALNKTEAFASGGIGTTNGSNETDVMGIGLRADSAANYYYRGFSNGIIDFESCNWTELTNTFPDKGKADVVSYGTLARGGVGYVFPTYPMGGSFSLDNILSINELESVSLQNCGLGVIQEKSVALLLDYRFGDLSYESGSGDYSLPTINFNNELRPTQLGSAYNLTSLAGTNVDNQNTLLPSYEGVISVHPIVNFRRGLDDNRYGSRNETNEYVFTGTYQIIDTPTTSYDVEVWGGDCFITKTNIKQSSSSVEIFSNKVKAYQGLHEILSYYVESEVCSDLQSSQYIYPVISNNTLGEFKSIYTYPYNPGYSVENVAKQWRSVSDALPRYNSFPTRIVYSDLKISNTTINGYDQYKALSFYDMDGQYGPITKIAVLPNEKPIAIQRNAVAYLPINKAVIEDGLGNQMLINTSTLIQKPQYASVTLGSSQIRTCVKNHEGMFFIDSDKKMLCYIDANVQTVSDMGYMNRFKNSLQSYSDIPEHKFVGGYDFTNRELFIGTIGFENIKFNDGVYEGSTNKEGDVYIWSDITKSFVSRFYTGMFALNAVLFGRSNLYVIGTSVLGPTKLHEMYKGNDFNSIFGQQQECYVTISINPYPEIGKVFDVLRVDSNNPISQVVLSTYREDFAQQFCTINTLNIKPRHDGYEFPSLRDQNQRLRGRYMQALIKMDATDRECILNAVYTKYRIEGRSFTPSK